MFLFKNPNGFYYLYFNCEITHKRKKISCKTKFKSEAVKFLSDFKNNLSGIETKRKQKEIKVHYISDLKTEVMKYVSDNFRKGTAEIYSAVFNNMLRIFKSDKPIRLLTNKDIEFYKSERLNEVSKSTVNIDLTTMKAIFNIAVKFSWMEKNPCKNVSKLTISEKEILSFSGTETKLILNNIQDKDLKNIVLFNLFTGCRINEILNIQWKDINLNERILYIRNKENFETKRGKNREIPISENLSEILSDLLNDKSDEKIIQLYNPDKYIFVNEKGFKYNKDYVSKKFKKVLRLLNFPEKFHFHCLRHTFITNLIKSGVNINYVKEIAGHSDIQTTMNYIHIVTNDLREAVNKINIV